MVRDSLFVERSKVSAIGRELADTGGTDIRVLVKASSDELDLFLAQVVFLHVLELLLRERRMVVVQVHALSLNIVAVSRGILLHKVDH